MDKYEENMIGGEKMRFNVELILDNEIIPKDKNRLIISFLKHCYEEYDKDYYKTLYELDCIIKCDT